MNHEWGQLYSKYVRVAENDRRSTPPPPRSVPTHNGASNSVSSIQTALRKSCREKEDEDALESPSAKEEEEPEPIYATIRKVGRPTYPDPAGWCGNQRTLIISGQKWGQFPDRLFEPTTQCSTIYEEMIINDMMMTDLSSILILFVAIHTIC